jgi:hypothetical protein
MKNQKLLVSRQQAKGAAPLANLTVPSLKPTFPLGAR